uniref:Putative lipocalin n=1 Tax=Amblyomma tuberculatum TaxID=48802 RepID=A0A6M2E416_9ACAR
MDLRRWCLLLLVSLVMLTNAANARKVRSSETQNGAFNVVTPWQFLSSANIYLNKTNISLPMQCIKAQTIARNRTTETLFHIVSYKIALSGAWGRLNASYKPYNKTGGQPAPHSFLLTPALILQQSTHSPSAITVTALLSTNGNRGPDQVLSTSANYG